ncbi:hypothetical protein [Neorhodopirellula pilleata]|uniref:Uncharacterized protein n=1 Tax=Neorhodopirellula pilleata TaxID=2714738 RepID=A0A5C6AWV8_9BACT|nr:hypothetical protein [Neorhodopirellula pilleata]TWU03556.1 hypothetical protein Pla100_04830 [Neorhodopirellula pilleata]
MAVRMNVLVLRPPGNGSKAHHQFDDVIGQLLGRPGLDVTLLERLPGPDESTTERLALESLGGHIACLAWAGASETVDELAAAGKLMSRRPHRGDPDAASVNGTPVGVGVGRMFFFDMRLPGANVSIFGDLQALLKTLQTPTFQIGPAAAEPKTAEPKSFEPKTGARTPVVTLAASSPINPNAAFNDNHRVDPRPVPLSAPKQPALEPLAGTPEASKQLTEDGDDLDRLVDKLDELDL